MAPTGPPPKIKILEDNQVSISYGKAEGQNGFKLSVFGFDPDADYDALTKEGRGRRAFPLAPDRSLLLTIAPVDMNNVSNMRIANTHLYS